MPPPRGKRVPKKSLDLTPYTGLWVAMVRGQVTGVGETSRQARAASRYQRPKDEPVIVFVKEKNAKRRQSAK
ncbi:MAG: hypothetical protein HY327_10215 [Chloroflexi bacterium]|nr:hypothetical protein [Chloroflexota bacterium]